VRYIALVVFLLAVCPVLGQTFDTDYVPPTREERFVPETDNETFAPHSDEGIFSTPVWSAVDLFGDFSRFRFGTVRYRERGLDSRHFRVTLGGVDLSDNLSSYPDWNIISLVRRSGLTATQSPAMVADMGPVSIGRSENYSLRSRGDDFYLILRTGDRYSRGGGDIRLGRQGEEGWSWSVAATGQGGNDGHFAGVYSDEAGGAGSLNKTWIGGTALTVFAAGGVSERGLRTAATAEAFSLTGDNFYNPVWGLQGGRVRNSRVARARYFFGTVSLTTPIDDRNTLSLTVAVRANRGGRTRLAWYDANSPLPDYYRSMPSFFPDWAAAEIISDAWRERDPTVTQVDWSDFYYNNTLATDGQATYIIEEQVEAARDVHLNLVVDRHVNPGLEISYGLRARFDVSRFYKIADDMLGAVWVPNVDQYITDDDGEPYTAPPNENDLRNPGRQVRRGERFGYDYRMTRLAPSVFGTVRWSGTGRGVTASASLGHTRLRREGFYEKELFPGSASFGPSKQSVFTTWSLAAAGWIDVGAGHGFSLSAMVGTEAPFADDIFLSPRQNNLTVADIAPSGVSGAGVAWSFIGTWVDLRLEGFVNSITGETQVWQYYDDLASRFADMAVRGIDRLGLGVEAGVAIRPMWWLTITAGASAGKYRYNSEPVATLYDDATGEIFSEGMVCWMSGLSTGVPSRVAGWEATFSNRRYLRFSLSGEWIGGRFVEVNPLFHSSRVSGINPAPEIMAQFTSQEPLPDAFTLGASLSKGWVVGRGFLRASASVRNLLGSTLIHSAYEQMRILRRGSGLDRILVPAPPKYLYSYPATWAVTVSYRL
jgi:hypothetical protein